ncbi:MAG: Crp/Fnr family transcriptional regulator [Candidatus Marinimicrobia bacterium]|nr:Crp/Fnr family transcriptional regulator [Candidatus Neomarinimicrobiota bacterium]
MSFLEQQLRRQYKPGETIFKDGDPGQTMFIILDGRIEISKMIGDQKTVLAVLEKGSIFGEMAIVDREPRSATAITLADTEMLEMSRDMFEDRISKVPSWLQSFFGILVDRLRKATRNQNVLITQGAGRQVVNLLSQIAKSMEPDSTGRIVFQIDDTSQYLAFLLGLENELVSKTLRKIVEAELASTARKKGEGRVLVFENPDRLHYFAKFCMERYLMETGHAKAMSVDFRFKNRHEVEFIQVVDDIQNQDEVPNEMSTELLEGRLKAKFKTTLALYQMIINDYIRDGLIEKFQPKDADPSYLLNDKHLFAKKVAKINAVKELMALEKKILI